MEGQAGTSENWLNRQARKEAGRDRIPTGERVGQIIGIVIILLVAYFFYIHLSRPTGFFTDQFGTDDTILLYLALLWGLVPSIIKVVTGRKNVARPFEIIGSIITIIALAWFLMQFPFDFEFFADALPDGLQFLLSWMTDDIARILMVIGIIGGIIGLVFQTLYFLFVRKELARH